MGGFRWEDCQAKGLLSVSLISIHFFLWSWYLRTRNEWRSLWDALEISKNALIKWFLTQKCRTYFLFYFRFESFCHFYVEVFTAQLDKYFLKWSINQTVFVYFIKTFSSSALSYIHFPSIFHGGDFTATTTHFIFRTPAIQTPVRRSAVHGNDKKLWYSHYPDLVRTGYLLAQFLFRNGRQTYMWLHSFPLSSHPARQLDRIASCVRRDISQQLQCSTPKKNAL